MVNAKAAACAVNGDTSGEPIFAVFDNGFTKDELNILGNGKYIRKHFESPPDEEFLYMQQWFISSKLPILHETRIDKLVTAREKRGLSDEDLEAEYRRRKTFLDIIADDDEDMFDAPVPDVPLPERLKPENKEHMEGTPPPPSRFADDGH